MKEITQCGAQGELRFILLDGKPKDVGDPVKREGGRFIVGHSETGHHHVISDEHVEMFTSGDPLVCYLRMETVAHVDHLRPHDTHETLALMGGSVDTPKWCAISHQREWSDEGERRALD